MSLSVLARLGGRGLVAVALTAAVFLAVAPAQADKREDKAEDKTADRRDEKRGARDEKRARADKDDAADRAVPRDLPAPEAAEAAEARALLATLASQPAGRKDAAQKLLALAPRAWGLYGAELSRARQTPVALRRAVLLAIDAAVPDASGKFGQPKRQKSSELSANDELDWLTALLSLDRDKVEAPRARRADKDDDDKDDEADDSPDASEAATDPAAIDTAIGEVIVDVALMRGLAAAGDYRAAGPLFDAAFAAETMIYRDECGRNLRKMEPRSIPVLTVESQGAGDRRRYATYQLERLDRQDPGKALTAATGDESLMIAIFDAFRVTGHREAVYAVFGYIDADSARIRAAARKTWLSYVTGRPPPPAPKRKMVLPGGKLADKETPMWLTYRELAEEQLRKASDELLGEELPEHQKVDLEALSHRVFDHFDAIRAKGEAEQWAQAQSLAKSGDLAGAAARLDQLLAINPDRAERAQMAEVYLAHAQALQKGEKWSEAAAAFSKAFGLAPEGAGAKAAAAGRDFALGKAMEAQGKDGTGLYRRAAVTKPDFEEASDAASGSRPRWMLYAASAAGLMAVILAALGLARRRRVA